MWDSEVVERKSIRYIHVARCPFVRVLASALRKTSILQCEIRWEGKQKLVQLIDDLYNIAF